MSVSMIGPKFYAWGRDGLPLAFGKLYTYKARTNAPKDTYQSEDGIVANTNPVILNGEGYADVYLDGSYKVVLKDVNENEIWSADPVTAQGGEEWVNCVSASYLSPTSFKVAGNVTDKYSVGRPLRIDNATSQYGFTAIDTAVFAGGETTITVLDSVILVGVVGVCASIVGDLSHYPATATGTTTPRTLGDWAEKEILSYDSVADVKADILLEVGSRVKTYGYYVAGDGGGATYLIAPTAAVDGHGNHALANGNIALLQITSSNVQPAQFGSSAGFLQAALDYAGLNNLPIELLPIEYAITLPIDIKSTLHSNGAVIKPNFGATGQPYAVSLQSCSDITGGLRIECDLCTTLETGFSVELDSIEPVRKMNLDVEVYDVYQSDNTKPCRGVLINISSGNLFDDYEIDLKALVKRVTGLGNGSVGDLGGLGNGISISTNKIGMSNVINIINPLVETVEPVEDGDGIVIYNIDSFTGDGTSKSVANILNPVIRACAKRAIKVMHPNTTILTPFIDTTLASGVSTTIAIESLAKYCTVTSPTLVNRGTTNGDGISNSYDGFVCTNINAVVDSGFNIFRMRSGTYDIRGGNVEWNYAKTSNEPAFQFTGDSSGYFECPTITNTDGLGQIVRYQAASGNHVLDMSSYAKAEELVSCSNCTGFITINNVVGEYKNTGISATGLGATIEIKGSHMDAFTGAGNAINSTALLRVTGSHYLETYTNGIVLNTASLENIIDGNITIKALGVAGNVGITTSSGVNTTVRGVTTIDFTTHIQVTNSDRTVIEGCIRRGSGTHLNTAGSTNLLSVNNHGVTP